MATDVRYAPIADYAVIGDCHSAALVRRDGSIDWACLDRFDSGGVFCGLLDATRGGCFRFDVRGLRSVAHRYLPQTNVLETKFVTRTGTARILDCFTMRSGGKHDPYRQLLRIVEGVRGKVAFEVFIAPRFDYASLHPWLRAHGGDRLFSASGGNDAFVLSSDCPLRIDREACTWQGSFAVGPRQRTRFSLVACMPHELSPKRFTARELDRRLRDTVAWWRRWVGRGEYGEIFGEELIRSSLVLKLLTCAPTGAIIAAPTTSLPERLRGSRNWDYRYCWLRDSTMVIAALLSVGQPGAASGLKTFIERSTGGRADELQIMYGCYGERRLPELLLPELEGYCGSRPVRAGNAAATQVQLDVYGELLEAEFFWHRSGGPLEENTWRFLRALVEAACEKWKHPDQGMWETRAAPRHFVHSKAMCWLAVSRGIQLSEMAGLACDVARWKKVCSAIRASIEKNGIDRRRGCFVQSYGSKEVDASLLRLPIIGFVDANDPRMRATVEAVCHDLSIDGLIRRYRPRRSKDGERGGEGAFLMASFWLVDVLTMQGRVDEAEQRFRHLLTLGNDLGLFSEEYDPRSKLLLGNFPQAFTHVALVSSAVQIQRARKGDGHRRPLGDRPTRSVPLRRRSA